MDSSFHPINHTHIIHTFQNLIVYFLERQRLVVLAILDIRPKLLLMEDADVPPIDLAPYIARVEEQEGKTQSPEALYQGFWKHDWAYRLHGIGCQLTHRTTREPLEWDAPNAKAFRFEWFWKHLLWRSQYESDDPFVAQSLTWITEKSSNQTEKLLVEKGIITQKFNGLSLLGKST